LYVVHVKKVTASEARKRWFRLLDDAAQGEVIVVERKGRRLVLRREELDTPRTGTRDYRRLLTVPDADRADQWSWEWRGGSLVPRRAPRR
jgi:hypothetical protein